jgi:hypothetical protein
MVFAFEPAMHIQPDDDAVEALRLELTARLERARTKAHAACA